MDTSNHNGNANGTGTAGQEGSRVFRLDPEMDVITEFIASVKTAPDVDEHGSRTTHMTPEDVAKQTELYLAALEAFRRKIEAKAPAPGDVADGLDASLARAEIRQEETAAADEFATEHLEASRASARAFHETFGLEEDRPGRFSVRRLGVLGERLVVLFVAGAESAMAYAGLSMAMPQSDAPSSDPLLGVLTSWGPEALAVAVGLVSAAVTVKVARNLALLSAARLETKAHEEGEK